MTNPRKVLTLPFAPKAWVLPYVVTEDLLTQVKRGATSNRPSPVASYDREGDQEQRSLHAEGPADPVEPEHQDTSTDVPIPPALQHFFQMLDINLLDTGANDVFVRHGFVDDKALDILAQM